MTWAPFSSIRSKARRNTHASCRRYRIRPNAGAVEPHPCAVLAGDTRSRRRSSVPAWPALFLMPAASAAHPRDPATYLPRGGPLTSGLKICNQTFPECPLLFEKTVICLFSHGPVAWPLLGRRCWWPYPSPRRHSQRTRAPAISRHVPAGNPWIISVRVRRALRPTRWVGWSPVPGHAGRQRLCPTSRPAVSLRGSLQAGH